MFQTSKYKVLALLVAMMAFANSAMAAITVDYAGLGTTIETEISSGLAVMVPIGGIVLAIGLAWKIGKRFVRG